MDFQNAGNELTVNGSDSAFFSFVLQVGTGTLQEATGCLELFQEDADELRSSTEELYFMEKQKGQQECEKPSSAQVMNEFLTSSACPLDSTSLTVHVFRFPGLR
jgi:hypothetical protein